LGLGAAPGGLYDVLSETVPASHAIVRTAQPNVDLLPSTPELAGADIDIDTEVDLADLPVGDED